LLVFCKGEQKEKIIGNEKIKIKEKFTESSPHGENSVT